MLAYILRVIIALIIVIPVMWKILSVIDVHLRQKNKAFIITSKHHRTHFLAKSYEVFSKFPLTKTYINRLRRIYELSYPENESVIIQKTMKLAVFIWTICFIEIVSFLLVYNSLYSFVNITIIVFFTVHEVRTSIIGKNEIKFINQFDVFLSGVRHRYYSDHFVDTAILESGEEAGKEMFQHAKLIEKIINPEVNSHSETGKEAAENATEEYNASIHNNYLKMFLSLCKHVTEYGDIKRNGTWVFVQNLSDMRNEINLELRNIKETNYLFQALTYVTMLPILSLYAIKTWAIANIPELDSFYHGRVGILFVLFLYLMTITCYTLVCHLKLTQFTEAKDHKILEWISNITMIKAYIQKEMRIHCTKHERKQDLLERIGESITAKQLYVKQLLYFTCTFIASLGLFIGLHVNQKHYLLSHVDTQITSSVTSSDDDILTETVLQYANKYKYKKISNLEIETLLENADTFSNSLTRSEVAKEIQKKINAFQNEYFKWYEVIIITILSIIAYHVPYWLIRYRIKVLEMTMENEVIQFQSIITMLMYMPNMSIQTILEQMETFAVIFKRSLQKCINNYPDGDQEALETLRDDEKFGPFQVLVDNFLTADKIGIELAFDEIATDRENSRERRKQESTFSRNKRAIYATVIAFIPVIAILVLYLIGPFLLECYRMYQNYRAQMSGMM